jgi:hypothetical protein
MTALISSPEAAEDAHEYEFKTSLYPLTQTARSRLETIAWRKGTFEDKTLDFLTYHSLSHAGPETFLGSRVRMRPRRSNKFVLCAY